MAASIPNTQIGVLSDESSSRLESFPVPAPGPGEVLIQNVAAAANPKDWKHPAWKKNFSYIEGSDVAGYVVNVGAGVSEFKGGERVAAFTPLDTQNSKYGTYCQYTVAPVSTTIPLPDNVSFEEAATLPLAVFTAAIGLFVSLGISLPPASGEPYKGSDRTQKAILVYGAASSVGAYVVQLAKRAGYFVVGVAGHSAEYAKSMGADASVDYRGKSIEQLEEDLVKAVSGYTCTLAYDTITEHGSTIALARALAKVKSSGSSSRVTHLLPLDEETKKQIPGGVEVIETYVGSAHEKDEAFIKSFARQLTNYLAPSPTNPVPFKPNRVKIMPSGLASVGEGLKLLKEGKVHGQKLVYRITDTPQLK
ncbi:hypothetical protein ACEPAI_1347 [Sanghuangporus weigelae]